MHLDFRALSTRPARNLFRMCIYERRSPWRNGAWHWQAIDSLTYCARLLEGACTDQEVTPDIMNNA